MERIPFDTYLMIRDLAAKGWAAKDLALKAGVNPSSVTRFLHGTHQTNRMLKRLAKALGYQADRYVPTKEQVEA